MPGLHICQQKYFYEVTNFNILLILAILVIILFFSRKKSNFVIYVN